MQRLIDKNIHQVENDKVCCQGENEILLFDCKGRNFCKINLEEELYSIELNNKHMQHCDNIICSDELKDIAIWIELKGNGHPLKMKKTFGQISTARKEFGQNINKNYGAMIINRMYTIPKAQVVLQNLKDQWEGENGEELFVGEKELYLEYDTSTQTVVQRT